MDTHDACRWGHLHLFLSEREALYLLFVPDCSGGTSESVEQVSSPSDLEEEVPASHSMCQLCAKPRRGPLSPAC